MNAYQAANQTAEIAFNSLQAPFFAKNHAMDELEAITQSRDAKTQRLREARHAKEQADQAAATSALLAKRYPMR
ncbi:hypothetical protein GAO09_11895 [Rhizobiales bacterium RZME27]|uniref:Uncharacterized protein n=1 Tax=Endobacterium cereale TaxID=2663029 RepID=A0A6A8A626_9HYPH|nr:hypothetical protein [Endobacterium cereale]MQY46735.1 hypothetical protein [Endobacterium cereale]